MNSQSASITILDEGKNWHVSGALVLHTYHEADSELSGLLTRSGFDSIQVDLAGLTALDTAGALLLRQLHEKALLYKKTIIFSSLRPEFQTSVELIVKADICCNPPERMPNFIEDQIVELGKGAVNAWNGTLELVSFIGHVWTIIFQSVREPKRFRIASISRHILETGIHAIPIVCLIAFLISIVLAYQGVFQMRPYGAEQFAVNLVAISVLREMGVLLTAIMVAGRSGSAFTAEIGVMKVREEVDALQVIGLSPYELLVVPRILALIITLPLLTFIANIMGLAGGLVVSYALIDMNLTQYIERVHSAISGWDLFVGLIKAPVFAFLIGVVGCVRGMQVQGSAESVGRLTTVSVVQSIFLVLMADAIFSIVFSHIGI
jgi:phospholipid/cholesterol/gamma-HCH transport system permease protein